MITAVNTISIDDNGRVIVYAIVEDSNLVSPQTKLDPPEYGPALCKSSFMLGDEDEIPNNEQNLIKFLQDLDLNWIVVDNDYSPSNYL